MKKLLFTCLFFFSLELWAEKKILFVMTGVDYITDSKGKKHSTGYWLEEFSTPYKIFKEAGHDIWVSTPLGTRPKADSSSLSVDQAGKAVHFKTQKEFEEALALKKSVLDESKIHSLKELVKSKKLDSFDAVFFPGGHAPMEDLMVDEWVAKTLRHFHALKKPTALVCHGPAAILSTQHFGSFLYKGYRVTSFTNTEEKSSAMGAHLRVTPEDALTQAGAKFLRGNDWNSFIVEDRELITGQNPASSEAIAQAVLKKLK